MTGAQRENSAPARGRARAGARPQNRCTGGDPRTRMGARARDARRRDTEPGRRTMDRKLPPAAKSTAGPGARRSKAAGEVSRVTRELRAAEVRATSAVQGQSRELTQATIRATTRHRRDGHPALRRRPSRSSSATLPRRRWEPTPGGAAPLQPPSGSAGFEGGTDGRGDSRTVSRAGRNTLPDHVIWGEERDRGTDRDEPR